MEFKASKQSMFTLLVYNYLEHSSTCTGHGSYPPPVMLLNPSVWWLHALLTDKIILTNNTRNHTYTATSNVSEKYSTKER